MECIVNGHILNLAELIWLKSLRSQLETLGSMPKSASGDKQAEHEHERESEENTEISVTLDESVNSNALHYPKDQTHQTRLDIKSEEAQAKSDNTDETPLVQKLPLPFKSIDLDRALHHIATWRADTRQDQLHLEATVQKTAQNGGLITLVYHQEHYQDTQVIFIEDCSKSMSPWFRCRQQLIERLTLHKSFAGVSHIRGDLSQATPRFFLIDTQQIGQSRCVSPKQWANNLHTSQEINSLSEIARLAEKLLVLVYTDGVARSLVNKRFARVLRGLGEPYELVILSPWNKSQWSRNALNNLFPTLPRTVTREDTLRRSVPVTLVHPEEQGLSLLADLRNKSKSNLKAVQLPTPRLIGEFKRPQNVNKKAYKLQRKNKQKLKAIPPDSAKIDYQFKVAQLLSNLSPASKELLVLSVTLPGYITLQILLAIGQHFLNEFLGIELSPTEVRTALSEVLTSGLLKSVDPQEEHYSLSADDELYSFVNSEARDALLTYIKPTSKAALQRALLRLLNKHQKQWSANSINHKILLAITILEEQDQHNPELIHELPTAILDGLRKRVSNQTLIKCIEERLSKVSLDERSDFIGQTELIEAKVNSSRTTDISEEISRTDRVIGNGFVRSQAEGQARGQELTQDQKELEKEAILSNTKESELTNASGVSIGLEYFEELDLNTLPTPLAHVMHNLTSKDLTQDRIIFTLSSFFEVLIRLVTIPALIQIFEVISALSSDEQASATKFKQQQALKSFATRFKQLRGLHSWVAILQFTVHTVKSLGLPTPLTLSNLVKDKDETLDQLLVISMTLADIRNRFAHSSSSAFNEPVSSHFLSYAKKFTQVLVHQLESSNTEWLINNDNKQTFRLHGLKPQLLEESIKFTPNHCYLRNINDRTLLDLHPLVYSKPSVQGNDLIYIFDEELFGNFDLVEYSQSKVIREKSLKEDFLKRFPIDQWSEGKFPKQQRSDEQVNEQATAQEDQSPNLEKVEDLKSEELIAFKKFNQISAGWNRGKNAEQDLTASDLTVINQVRLILAEATQLKMISNRVTQEAMINLGQSIQTGLIETSVLTQPSLSLLVHPWIRNAPKFKQYTNYPFNSFPHKARPKREARDEYRKAVFITLAYKIKASSLTESELSSIQNQLQKISSSFAGADLCFYQVKTTPYFGFVKRVCTTTDLSVKPDQNLQEIAKITQTILNLLGVGHQQSNQQVSGFQESSEEESTSLSNSSAAQQEEQLKQHHQTYETNLSLTANDTQVLHKFVKALEGYNGHEERLPAGFLEARDPVYQGTSSLIAHLLNQRGIQTRRLGRAKIKQLFGFKYTLKLPKQADIQELGIDSAFVGLFAAPTLWQLTPKGDKLLEELRLQVIRGDSDTQLEQRRGLFVVLAYRLPTRRSKNGYIGADFQTALRAFVAQLKRLSLAEPRLFNLGQRTHIGVIVHISNRKALESHPELELANALDHFEAFCEFDQGEINKRSVSALMTKLGVTFETLLQAARSLKLNMIQSPDTILCVRHSKQIVNLLTNRADSSTHQSDDLPRSVNQLDQAETNLKKQQDSIGQDQNDSFYMQALKTLVTPMVEKERSQQEPHLDALVDVVVNHLMIDSAYDVPMLIQKPRRFAQQTIKLVQQLLLEHDQRIDELLRVTVQIARTTVAKDDEIYMPDLIQSVRIKLLSEQGRSYLFGSHTPSYINQRIRWWLSNELRRIKRPHGSLREYVTSENAELNTFDNLESSNSDIVNTYVEKENREAMLRVQYKRLVPSISRLSTIQRNALIARQWFTLIEYASKEQLAEDLVSPLGLEERIKLLDEIKDDQERMVKLSFPELNKEDNEFKVKLESLTRSYNRAIKSLKSLMEKQTKSTPS